MVKYRVGKRIQEIKNAKTRVSKRIQQIKTKNNRACRTAVKSRISRKKKEDSPEFDTTKKKRKRKKRVPRFANVGVSDVSTPRKMLKIPRNACNDCIPYYRVKPNKAYSVTATLHLQGAAESPNCYAGFNNLRYKCGKHISKCSLYAEARDMNYDGNWQSVSYEKDIALEVDKSNNIVFEVRFRKQKKCASLKALEIVGLRYDPPAKTCLYFKIC